MWKTAVANEATAGFADDFPPRVTFDVDPSMYNGSCPSGLREFSTALEGIVRTDLRYHYSGPICAHRWISLCGDPEYGHLRLVALIDAALPKVVKAAKADAGDLTAVDLVSLGPGDGAIDLRILRRLQADLLLRDYYCLDSSFDLLCYAVKHILRNKALRDLKIRATCGDFTKVRSLGLAANAKGHARLFALTGFTLGNFREDELLTQISPLMSGQDYLLLDARLHHLDGWDGKKKLNGKEKSALQGHYQPESVKRFVFGPVETTTYAKSTDVQIEYEVAPKRMCVPGAVQILIFCKSLDTTMRLTGKRIRKQRLDLAGTTLYGYSELASWLESKGFQLVWRAKAAAVGLFLLRRRQ
jgi:hypothetical protein